MCGAPRVCRAGCGAGLSPRDRTMYGTARPLTRSHDGCCSNSFSTCRPIRCRGPPRPFRSAPSRTSRSRSPRCCRMGSGRFLRRRSGGSGRRLRVAASEGCFCLSVGSRAQTCRSANTLNSSRSDSETATKGHGGRRRSCIAYGSRCTYQFMHSTVPGTSWGVFL